MNARGRLAAALFVVAVSVALPFARTPAGPARPLGTASFSAMGLSFRYPPVWRSGTSNDVSSFEALIVYLSTSRMNPPCPVINNVRTRACFYPLTALPPGGVLVRWAADGFPDYHLSRPNATIGGRPAVETTTSEDGWCQALGGTVTIVVMISRDVPDNFYEMDACLHAPGLAQQEAQISAMLSTVRIAKGD